jgi:ATP-dependent protease ClpP protease subunit
VHGEQLVPAVTELIIAELLYLQYKDRSKPIFLYINSTGTTRADGETVRARWRCQEKTMRHLTIKH